MEFKMVAIVEMTLKVNYEGHRHLATALIARFYIYILRLHWHAMLKRSRVDDPTPNTIICLYTYITHCLLLTTAHLRLDLYVFSYSGSGTSNILGFRKHGRIRGDDAGGVFPSRGPAAWIRG